ncbi:MAG: oligosaccharide flippase family protein, partial [Acidimicrobiales bacterium]
LTRLRALDRRRRDALISAGSSFGVYGLSVLTGPLLGRALGPAGRGDLAAVVVPTQLLAWILTFGIPAASAYYAPTHKRRELNMGAWVFALLVGAPLAAVAWPLVPRYLQGHDPVTIDFFRAGLVAGLLILPQYACLDCLNGRGRNLRFNALRHLALVSYSLCVLVLAATDRLTLRSALTAWLVSNLFGAAAAFSYGWGWPTGGFRLATLRAQLRYGSRVAFGQAAQMVMGRLDQFMMVGLVSPTQLGLYAVAVTAAGVSGAIGSGLALAVFPHVRNAATVEERRATLQRSLRWVAVASLSLGTLVGVSAPWVLTFLFGPEFSGSLTPLWILLPGQFCYDLANLLSSSLQAQGRPGSASRGLALAAAITAVGLLLAVRPYGIVGAAAVTTFSQFAFLCYVAAASKRSERRVVDLLPQTVAA